MSQIWLMHGKDNGSCRLTVPLCALIVIHVLIHTLQFADDAELRHFFINLLVEVYQLGQHPLKNPPNPTPQRCTKTDRVVQAPHIFLKSTGAPNGEYGCFLPTTSRKIAVVDWTVLCKDV